MATSEMDLGDERPVKAQPADVERFNQPFDLSTLLAMFRRRIRLFGLIVALLTVASVAVTLKLTPVYASTAEIKIDPTQHRVIDPNAVTLPDQAIVDTEFTVIRSHDVAAAEVGKFM